MGLSSDKILTTGGGLFFIPSGSGASGAVQKYAVTMSGVAATASMLAPANETSSFWYIRTPGTPGHSVKVFYQNNSGTSVEPTGSHINLFNMSQRLINASGSVVQVKVSSGTSGSAVIARTVGALTAHPTVKTYFTISSSNDNIFIDNRVRGVAVSDDISFANMTGSITYNVIQSGSNSTINRTSVLTGSSTVNFRLNETDKDKLETAMESSASYMNLQDGFYGIAVTNAQTGSNISMHGGPPFDYGRPLPNSPYIKTNGGFDILMDNDNGEDNSSFRIFKDTGIAGIAPGTELLTLDNDGNLTVAGTISNASGSIDGGSF